MPIYAYQAKKPEASCEKCKGGFDLRQSLSDPALETCPWCGAPIARVPSLPAIGFSQSGLDDRAIEMCKYVTKQEAGKPGMDLKFLRLDGADNELVFTYPAAGQMELLAVGFNVYEDCLGILQRNSAILSTKGFARIDGAWVNQFMR